MDFLTVRSVSLIVSGLLVTIGIAGTVLGVDYNLNAAQIDTQTLIVSGYLYNTNFFTMRDVSLEYQAKLNNTIIASDVLPFGDIPARDYIQINETIRFSQPVTINDDVRFSGVIRANWLIFPVSEDVTSLVISKLV